MAKAMPFRFDRRSDDPEQFRAISMGKRHPEIATMADRGQDISVHLTNQFTVVRPAVQRVNVDVTAPMLKELDHEAETLNISRQAVMKIAFRELLDRRSLP